MRIVLIFLFSLLTCSVANADFFGKVLDGVNSRISEKVMRDAGKAIQKSAQDAAAVAAQAATPTSAPIKTAVSMAAIQAFVSELRKLTDERLFYLSFSLTPCAEELICHGVPDDLAKQAISAIQTQKQAAVDLAVREYQAMAAMASAGLALLSLVISILSFVRAGRKDTPKPTPESGGAVRAA